MGGIGSILAILVSFNGIPDTGAASTRVDRVAVNGGGELLTLYRQVPNHSEVPVVAVLRDTMGDGEPANDRLRYVWILTDRRAPWYKHALAAIPFLYTRSPSRLPSPKHRPSPVLDLSKPGDRSVASLAKTLLQSQAFDPMGAAVRTSTRSYRMNEEYRRQTRVTEAMTALSDLERSGGPSLIDKQDLQQLRARLLLSTKTLGGWVQESGLPRVYTNDVLKIEEMRGHNWDLLRQSAELNGLSFEPVRLAGGPPSHAMLWVAKSDLTASAATRKFHGKFLKISSPWGDEKLLNWKGFTAKREWDGQEAEMIPLALYALDHPKIPHLVADMRDAFAPTRREMFRRAVTDTTAGVLGLSGTGNLGLYAASFGWSFVSNRWGAANNRAWRVRSYSELRYRLAIDTSLDPALRQDLEKRAEWLAMNPFEESVENEIKIAKIQQAALVEWAGSPKAALKLNKDRREELALLRRSDEQRVWASTARIASLGLYRKRALDVPASYAELDQRRRVATHAKFLTRMLEKGDPHPEVAWNANEVRAAVSELGRLRPQDPEIVALVNRVLHSMEDQQARAAVAEAWRESAGGVGPAAIDH
jgi:hypothetical protein